jgi:16S rRNA G966 N2-methylase RsmD
VVPEDVDIVYFDPPYEFQQYSKLLMQAGTKFPNSLLIIEHSSRKNFETPPGFEPVRTVKIGETELSFYRSKQADSK